MPKIHTSVLGGQKLLVGNEIVEFDADGFADVTDDIAATVLPLKGFSKVKEVQDDGKVNEAQDDGKVASDDTGSVSDEKADDCANAAAPLNEAIAAEEAKAQDTAGATGRVPTIDDEAVKKTRGRKPKKDVETNE